MSHQRTEDELVVYSDYVCPFCYLGKVSLEEYLANADDPPEVEWHPFDLRGYKRGPDGEIDHGVDDGKDDAYFEQVRRNVQRLKERYDVEMSLDFSKDVDSWNAQAAALAVRDEYDEGTFEAFHEAVFEALWGAGRDIGDVDVLVDIAEGVGVSERVVRDAVDDDDRHEELTARFEEARERGITGIPTFVYDGHAARGAVPPAQLERLVGD